MSTNTATISRPKTKTRRTSRPTAEQFREPRPIVESAQVVAAQPVVEPAPWDWTRSAADELVNTITHGAGLLLAIVGATFMAATVWGQVDAWRMTGCAVFLFTMIAVYACSTLSHAVSHLEWKYFLRQVDQGVIYLLVVGTYTPFGLAYVRTGFGWALLATLWAGAIAGFLAKVVFAHRINNGSVWTYVILGILPTIVIPYIWHTVPTGTGVWMVVGGACYLVGTIFLTFDARVRHFHAVWHLLVIAGSACHFLGVLTSVAVAG